MGTVHYLTPRRACDAPPLTITSHGFSIGSNFVAWQSVSEIRAWKCEGDTDSMFLGFIANACCLTVSADSAGFDALDAAMVAVFPATHAWRDAAWDACAAEPTVLFRRIR